MGSVVLKNVCKSYGDTHVIRDVSLEIPDGEFCVLVGPSGCGKSTLLRMIAGLEEISGGTVGINDRDVTDVEPKMRDIAMVFQSYALYPQMTVRENMGFALKMAKMSKADINQKVESTAELRAYRHCWSGYRKICPAVSASGLLWGAPSCVTHKCSCSTSLCRTWMPNCELKCAARSANCISG